MRETSSIFIDEIPERTGQILRQVLSDRLTPKGEPEKPHYRLSVGLSAPNISEQAVRRDNLATRYMMSISASYKLYSYPENQLLLSDSVNNRAGYDVQRSPYATDMAERMIKERIVRIMGGDIALRLAAFLKSYKPAENTEQTEEKETFPEIDAPSDADRKVENETPAEENTQ